MSAPPPPRYSEQSVQIQDEMVNRHQQLNETEAGQTLYKALQKLLEDQEDANRKLRELAGRQDNELLVQQLNARNAELEEKIRQTKRQISKLRIRWLQQLSRFLRMSVLPFPSNLFLILPLSGDDRS